jgi:hypothetical protein
MDSASLHSPVVRQAIEALNTGRLEDFLALFTPDAVVVDSATYADAASIRAWAQRENFSVHMHIDVVRELDASGTSLEITASSKGGYNGSGTFTFTLLGDQIARLVIG